VKTSLLSIIKGDLYFSFATYLTFNNIESIN